MGVSQSDDSDFIGEESAPQTEHPVVGTLEFGDQILLCSATVQKFLSVDAEGNVLTNSNEGGHKETLTLKGMEDETSLKYGQQIQLLASNGKYLGVDSDKIIYANKTATQYQFNLVLLEDPDNSENTCDVKSGSILLLRAGNGYVVIRDDKLRCDGAKSDEMAKFIIFDASSPLILTDE
jgi:hypothetical protein